MSMAANLLEHITRASGFLGLNETISNEKDGDFAPHQFQSILLQNPSDECLGVLVAKGCHVIDVAGDKKDVYVLCPYAWITKESKNQNVIFDNLKIQDDKDEQYGRAIHMIIPHYELKSAKYTIVYTIYTKEVDRTDFGYDRKRGYTRCVEFNMNINIGDVL